MMIEKTVDRGSKEKLYVQVYAIFLEKIESGEWPDGSQIPPEAELCRMYDVSKVTVREAIQQLMREGYLRHQRGRGTFVTYTAPRAGIMMKVWLSEYDLLGERVKISKKVIERGVRASPDELKGILKRGELYFMMIAMAVQSDRFAEEFSLPVFLVSGLQAQRLSNASTYDLIEAKGTKKVFRVMQTTEIGALDEKVASIVGATVGAPALIATVHKKLENVAVNLTIAFLVGSAGGTFIGGWINKTLYNKDPLLSEAFISTVYAVLLGFSVFTH